MLVTGRVGGGTGRELAAEVVVAALDRARVLNVARLPIAPRRSADAAGRASISPLLELVAEGGGPRDDLGGGDRTSSLGFVSSCLGDSSALVVLPCLDHFLGFSTGWTGAPCWARRVASSGGDSQALGVSARPGSGAPCSRRWFSHSPM